MKRRPKESKEIMSPSAATVRAVKTETKAIRVPTWLLEISEKAQRKCGAEDFSDYLRGLMLKDVKRLGFKVPEETHEDWPAWVKKTKHEVDEA
jgi:hypothetical protein